MHKVQVAAWIAVACLLAAPVRAQELEGGPPADVRAKIGPLSMNPTINLSNIGIDHNVFNDPPEKGPKEDFTATIVPATDFWLRAGPTWVTSSLAETLTWYQKYASERSASTLYRLGWTVPGSRLTLKLNTDWVHAKDRPGYEIDARVDHHDTTYSGSVDVHTFSQTSIVAAASRVNTDFADEASFEGVNLHFAMNRHATMTSLGVKQQITALTSLSVTGVRTVDSFEFIPGRDATTTSGTVSVAFQPAALLKGGFSVGYSQFKPDAPTLPAFSGLTYTLDLTYVLLGSTRFAATGSRGVQYSYDSAQPYYVQTGIDGSIAQELFGPIDIAARAGTQDLAYRDAVGATVAVANRNDNVFSYGIGVGIHMGRDLRLSFNVDKVYRDSKVADRNYDNYTFTSSLHYGF